MKPMTTAIGTRVQFLSLDSVQVRHNVVQTVCEATKHPDNPLLQLGNMDEWDAVQARPWETRTIVFDEEDGIFKCWYCGSDLDTKRWWASGYAESEDGLNWTKPNLGLFEYNGNKNNNICHLGYGPVIKDPADPDPNKRYKMILKPPVEKAVRVDYSPDGKHWNTSTRINNTPAWEEEQQVHGRRQDFVVLLRDDQDPDPQRRYKVVWQSIVKPNKPGPKDVRSKSLVYGPDVENLTDSPANPIISPNDGLEQEIHFLMLTPYRGMYAMLYEYGWYAPNDTGVYGSYCADIRLAFSRDGDHYERVQPHQKVIVRGQRGEWDDGFLVISDKPVIKDDKIYLYYCGQGEDWTCWPGTNKPPTYKYASSGSVRVSRMGLATLRLDGFTCLETTDRETPGIVTTEPIDVTNKDVQLVVNVGDVQRDRSWVEVEVIDAEGEEVLSGFSREECVDVYRDAVRVPVAWKAASLSELDRSRIRLRFHLYGAARLYAFGFDRA